MLLKKMFIKKFDHPYLKLIKDLDIQDLEAKRSLIEQLTFKTIKEKVIVHSFLTFMTFGYHYFKLRKRTSQAIEEAISARKLNALLSLKHHKELSECSSFKQIYSKKELYHLKNNPISEYQLLKVLYFQNAPFKYRKVWQSLFHPSTASLPHEIDSINLYYDRLTTNHSIPHDQIMKHLKKKIEGRPAASLTTQELQLAFKELIDSQRAS